LGEAMGIGVSKGSEDTDPGTEGEKPARG